ncbi:MAG: endonuclease/exonuclease/phosphatase family protein [bacterium]
MRKISFSLWLFLFPLVVLCQTLNLKVMTFNIRYNNPNDGPFAWQVRMPMVINVIQQENPDILCCQEVLYDQVNDLQHVLPGYQWTGVGRDDGNRSGEFVPIFYNMDRFNMKAKGTFWLSETPNSPGTKSWDAACNRIVTWVKIKDMRFKKNIFIFNTHFDHQSKLARSESASLLLSAIRQIAGDDWVIVCGDFNDTEGSEMYNILTGGAMNLTLINTTRISRQEPSGPDYTFIGFPFKPEKGNTIDFIFTRNNKSATVLEHRVITYNVDGRYPSDHLPVIVNFELKLKKRRNVF